MRRAWGVSVLVCAACLAMASAAGATEIIVPSPTDDVNVQSAFPNTNFNYYPESTKLIAMHSYIGPYNTNSLLKFDVSAIPDSATIISAELYLYCVPTSNEKVFAYRMGEDNWSEGTVTWNSYAAAMSDKVQLDVRDVVVGYGGDYWEAWDLSSLNWQADLSDNTLTLMLAAWVDSVNYFSPANMCSKEYTDVGGTHYTPYLRIEYIPEPASLGLLGIGLATLAARRRKAR